jgi:hypothetical protein
MGLMMNVGIQSYELAIRFEPPFAREIPLLSPLLCPKPNNPNPISLGAARGADANGRRQHLSSVNCRENPATSLCSAMALFLSS